MTRAILPLIAIAPLLACSPQPEPATPAFWQVDCPNEQQAFLFGTVHALEKPSKWQSPVIESAFAKADMLMVEIVPLDDKGATFSRLANTPGIGALSERIDPAKRPALIALLNKSGLTDAQFADVETWAAALMIAQSQTKHLNSEYGIDGAVLAAAKGKSVEELEGMEGQLRIFDGLPENEQRDLLAAIVDDAADDRDDAADLAVAWKTGDMVTITKETERGMLADPELRQALFTGRNHNWVARIRAAMAKGKRPFIAVGAAHMAGHEGLPVLLEAGGCRVHRTQ